MYCTETMSGGMTLGQDSGSKLKQNWVGRAYTQSAYWTIACIFLKLISWHFYMVLLKINQREDYRSDTRAWTQRSRNWVKIEDTTWKHHTWVVVKNFMGTTTLSALTKLVEVGIHTVHMSALIISLEETLICSSIQCLVDIFPVLNMVWQWTFVYLDLTAH